ncbi:hypothetical protein SAY86_002829 [Trapa natans]|uniref:Uncharacterized protein n=1 Tax=Trapa natans TaxID=22666 RepID=A0AAN7R2V1_TRANT|nr:hypothetical protein SAY86_002829 [Trapa natans]
MMNIISADLYLRALKKLFICGFLCLAFPGEEWGTAVFFDACLLLPFYFGCISKAGWLWTKYECNLKPAFLGGCNPTHTTTTFHSLSSRNNEFYILLVLVSRYGSFLLFVDLVAFLCLLQIQRR